MARVQLARRGAVSGGLHRRLTFSRKERTSMLDPYVPILVMLGVAIFVAIFVITVSRFLGPQRPTRRKLMPYESGMEPIGPAQRRFPVKFNLVAMLFILFDIEVVFLYPVATIFSAADSLFVLVEVIIFVALLFVAFIYVWRKGALDWR
jgi:NADH-quinone oxidoreductase subunit A